MTCHVLCRLRLSYLWIRMRNHWLGRRDQLVDTVRENLLCLLCRAVRTTKVRRLLNMRRLNHIQVNHVVLGALLVGMLLIKVLVELWDFRLLANLVSVLSELELFIDEVLIIPILLYPSRLLFITQINSTIHTLANHGADIAVEAILGGSLLVNRFGLDLVCLLEVVDLLLLLAWLVVHFLEVHLGLVLVLCHLVFDNLLWEVLGIQELLLIDEHLQLLLIRRIVKRLIVFGSRLLDLDIALHLAPLLFLALLRWFVRCCCLLAALLLAKWCFDRRFGSTLLLS